MKDDSGFTLLEVLIALQIVLVCMLFVFPCVHAMKVLSEDSRQTDDAMALYFSSKRIGGSQQYTSFFICIGL